MPIIEGFYRRKKQIKFPEFQHMTKKTRWNRIGQEVKKQLYNMDKKEKKKVQEEYIEAMIKYLPVLRKSVNFTQDQLAVKLDISRQTLAAIENRKRALSWAMYLAAISVFNKYENSKELIYKLNLFEPEFIVDL